jgi:hypothetical protein
MPATVRGPPVSAIDFVTLPEWQRARRHAVPGWMIAACAEARSRGDWRAACEAAAVDVTFSPGAVSPGAVSSAAEDLLAGFAPDLLRWHLPRAIGGSTMLDPGLAFVLAPDGPVGSGTVVLVVRTPPSVGHAQRLTLQVARAGEVDGDLVHPVPPYLWDARRAGGLRAAVGGSAVRLPRFTPAGEPLPASARGAGDDPPARAERILATPGRPETWAMAGWQFDRSPPPHFYPLRQLDPMLTAQELRRVAVQFGRRSWAVRTDHYRRQDLRLEVDGDQVRVVELSLGRLQDNPFLAVPCLHPGLLRAPVDLDLILDGRIDPADLHPLVREALFPGTPGGPVPAAMTAGLTDHEPVRVRCGGVWHRVAVRSGRPELLDHSPEQQRREAALDAFGGAVTGCFAVARAWRVGGRLPRRLRAQRQALWLGLHHGGTRVLDALLDAGLDPHSRDSGGRTLLHELARFDLGVLPRLLARGLDVNARARDGLTPLHLAVSRRWPAAMVTALVDAGADPHAANNDRMSVLDLLSIIEDTTEDLAPEWAAAIAYVREKA